MSGYRGGVVLDETDDEVGEYAEDKGGEQKLEQAEREGEGFETAGTHGNGFLLGTMGNWCVCNYQATILCRD